MWCFCILHQEWLLWRLNDIATGSRGVLPVEQKAKLYEAMALVGRTQVPLCCNVCMHKQGCTMEFICLMPLQRKAG